MSASKSVSARLITWSAVNERRKGKPEMGEKISMDLTDWIKKYFHEKEAPGVLKALEEYGAESWHKEPERVRRDIVIASRGDTARLRELLELAKKDYRDLLVGEHLDPWLRGELMQVRKSGRAGGSGTRKIVLIVLGVPAVLFGIMIFLMFVERGKMMFALASDTRGYGALHNLRRHIWDYSLANGRLPADLSGFKVPELKLYSFETGDRGMHRHRISGVELRPGAGLENFSVMFSTYISGGHAGKVSVLGDFNGYDPVKGLMSDKGANGFSWGLEVPLPPGRYSFKIAADGREGPLETIDVNYATQHPNVSAGKMPELAGDSGKWLYDPQTGLLVIGCSGRETKSRALWYTR